MMSKMLARLGDEDKDLHVDSTRAGSTFSIAVNGHGQLSNKAMKRRECEFGIVGMKKRKF